MYCDEREARANYQVRTTSERYRIKGFIILYFDSVLRKILSQKFFNRPTLRVAEELLGKFLIRRIGNRTISVMITEVEAYVGHEDKASHASRGKTKRNEAMFGRAGRWYVYMIYGMYYCLNIVTEKKEYPAAILIRSVENIKGPGRICRHFKINKRFNGVPVSKKIGLWIEDGGVKLSSRMIKRGRRIGIDYAGKWTQKLWRLYIK